MKIQARFDCRSSSMALTTRRGRRPNAASVFARLRSVVDIFSCDSKFPPARNSQPRAGVPATTSRAWPLTPRKLTHISVGEFQSKTSRIAATPRPIVGRSAEFRLRSRAPRADRNVPQIVSCRQGVWKSKFRRAIRLSNQCPRKEQNISIRIWAICAQRAGLCNQSLSVLLH